VGAPAWVTWTLQVLRPSKPTPAVPVVLTGDACWGHPDDAVRRLFADSGVALAWFNRTELAHDAPDAARAGPVFDRYPQARFGAIAAWAWGLGRSVDVLRQIPGIDAACVSVVGHSRGGKAALLAGAADSRIWMTAAHNSGTGGAASSVVTGAGAETLADLARTFPHWLGRDAAQLMATGSLQGLDQHLLLARIAPRRLLLIQARDDAWANPEGLRAAARRAAAAWRSTGAAGGLRVVWRDGGHAMGLADWRVVARVVAQASV
jgi:dienelactone hydrolase